MSRYKYKVHNIGVKLKIEKIRIKKETAKYITLLTEQRIRKEGTLYHYFDTWDEAHSHMIIIAERNLYARKKFLEEAEEVYEQALALKQEKKQHE